MNESQLIEMFGKMINEQIAVLDRNLDKKLDEKLRPIHNEISEIKRDITTMQGDITGVKRDITTMQDDITVMKSDITFIKGHIVSLDNHMDQMISKFIPELKNEIFEIRQENRALAHMFGEHALEIEKLKS